MSKVNTAIVSSAAKGLPAKSEFAPITSSWQNVMPTPTPIPEPSPEEAMLAEMRNQVLAGQPLNEDQAKLLQMILNTLGKVK